MTELREQIFDIITDAPCRKCEFWDWQGRYCWLKNMHPDSRKCTLLDQILKPIEAQYQPVQLEVLTDEEMFEIYSTEGLDSLCFKISQATNEYNLKANGGQLYRKT